MQVRSKEGVDLEIPFEVTFQMDDQALAAFLGSRGERGTPQDVARLAASELVSKWSAGGTTESLVLGQGGADLETKLKERLEGHGFASVTLRLQRPRGSDAAVAAITERALRDRMSDTKVKVAVLGLDGADWEIIDPLIAKGLLPNLARSVTPS